MEGPFVFFPPTRQRSPPPRPGFPPGEFFLFLFPRPEPPPCETPLVSPVLPNPPYFSGPGPQFVKIFGKFAPGSPPQEDPHDSEKQAPPPVQQSTPCPTPATGVKRPPPGWFFLEKAPPRPPQISGTFFFKTRENLCMPQPRVFFPGRVGPPPPAPRGPQNIERMKKKKPTQMESEVLELKTCQPPPPPPRRIGTAQSPGKWEKLGPFSGPIMAPLKKTPVF